MAEKKKEPTEADERRAQDAERRYEEYKHFTGQSGCCLVIAGFLGELLALGLLVRLLLG